jgi:integrase
MEPIPMTVAAQQVIAALKAAGRSAVTVKRHQAVFNAFARFCSERAVEHPGEVDCLAFVAATTGTRLGALREPTGYRDVQLARRPLILLMEAVTGAEVAVGELSCPPLDPCPARFRCLRDDYLEQCRARGNAAATVVSKRRAADQYLAHLDATGRDAAGDVTAMDVASFWAARKHYARKTVASLRTFLADFLAYLHGEGLTAQNLADRLPRRRVPRHGEHTPQPWTGEQIQAVLEQIDRRSAIGKRDYAMILLTARLGLRVGDLRRLELGWFDWRAKTVSLTQHKTGRPLTLPLPADVGWAVIDYIRGGRPDTDSPQVFIKHRYPFTAFGSSTSASCRLRRYVRRAGIAPAPGQLGGLHSLRGALAVALLQTDTPLPVVTAVLGHATTKTTASNYLRFDVEHLRRCALDVEDAPNAGKEAQR